MRVWKEKQREVLPWKVKGQKGSDARLLDTERGKANGDAGRQGADCFFVLMDTYSPRLQTASPCGRCLKYSLGGHGKGRKGGREGRRKGGRKQGREGRQAWSSRASNSDFLLVHERRKCTLAEVMQQNVCC